MRKGSIWKSTFREIKSSFGRFAAILAIIALGVGFFAGLKVTEASMIASAQQYLEEMQLYDYRILSTMGFEQADVEYLQQQEGVRAASGAVSFDIIYRNAQGNEGVAKAHSLMENLNGVKLLYGRMPQEPWECVADSNVFEQKDIGSVLTLSDTNAQEDLEHFAYKEYTIVGIIQASAYIQFERGNTSLGAGRITGFLYLPRDGFASEYDTEIYVKFDRDFPLYSDAYETFLEEKEPEWEELSNQAAIMRYDRVVTEARKEIEEAGEKLASEKADAEEELAEAGAELAEAEAELADAQVQLADAGRKLADAKEELAEAERTLGQKEAELADAGRIISEKEAELADAKREYEDGVRDWEFNDREVSEAEDTIREQREQLDAQRALLQEKELELKQGEQLLDAAQARLEQQKKEAQNKGEELDALELFYLQSGQTIPDEVRSQIDAGREELRAGLEQIEAGIAGLAAQRSALETGKAELAAGYAGIQEYQRQLEGADAMVTDGRNKLSAAYMQLQGAGEQIAGGEIALEEARLEMEAGRLRLSEAKQELAEAKKTLARKENEYLDAVQEYEDGLAEYEDGLAQYQDGVAELAEKVADAEAELAEAETELADLEKPDTYLLGRDTNIGYVCFENDSGIVAGIANIFPVFFFLVAALVCITTMNRMVEEQRTQIGVLKALGYGDGIIMFKYLIYSGSAAFIGAVAGFFGGTWLFPRVIWTCYGIMYRMDNMVYVFDGQLAAVSLSVALLCSAGATWISCRYELFEAAAQLMRPKAPKAGKRVLLERISFLWKRLGFLKKVSVRNIFRYKKRLFMMVLGISGCTALLVTGFGIKDSIANIATQQFEEIQIYDVAAVAAEPLDQEQLQELARLMDGQAKSYEKVMEGAMDVVTAEARKSVNLVVAEAGADITPFVDLHTPDGEKLAYPGPGEAVISRKLSETMKLKEGDSILLQNDEMEAVTAVVSGVCENFIYNYVYLGSDTYEGGTGRSPEYKSIYINAADGVDVHTVAALVIKQDSISSVTVNADTMERFSGMMNSLNLIVIVVILCAAGLALIVLYNLTNINITERIREIATIKVLGFYKKETCSYVFRENMLLTALGVLPGLALGFLLHQVVMKEINIDMVTFDIHVRPVSCLYSIVLTFVFAWLVNHLMSGKLDRISMTESLKSVD